MDSIEVTVSVATIEEGGTLFASAEFFDGVTPVTPDNVDYKIDLAGASFVAAGLIRNWTAAAPGPSTSVLLENQDTDIVSSISDAQSMQVVFRATLGLDTVYAAGYYEILAGARVGTNVSYTRRRLVVIGDRVYEIRSDLELAMLLQESQMIVPAETTPAPALEQTTQFEMERTVIPRVLPTRTIAMPSTNTGIRQLARRVVQ